MKKIIVLIAMTFLLTACGKVEAPSTSSWSEDSTVSGVVQGDENAKDPEMLSTGTTSTASWTIKAGTSTSTNSNVTTSNSRKSEDEIVKDFEKEIDSLLNSIDTDGKKK
jgi:ABC-type glycerol-3-phosphate transport system substrate-binding protein